LDIFIAARDDHLADVPAAADVREGRRGVVKTERFDGLDEFDMAAIHQVKYLVQQSLDLSVNTQLQDVHAGLGPRVNEPADPWHRESATLPTAPCMIRRRALCLYSPPGFASPNWIREPSRTRTRLTAFRGSLMSPS
jgi:hypothetical protein